MLKYRSQVFIRSNRCFEFHSRLATRCIFSSRRRTMVTFTPAEKQHLFSFRDQYRWMYNEIEQYNARQISFDPDAVQRIAGSIVGGDCTQFERFTDGAYNRIYILGFDNRKELILRIPWSPVAGPSYFMTASEVATMEFMREVLDAPVPRVLAWSANAQTSPIGSEFILMEGVLGRCSELAFSQIGSLYFKEDVSEELQGRPLFSKSVNLDENLRKASEKYRVGPIADRHWWRCGRANMDLDRGPWPDVASYFRAAVHSEIAFIKSPYALSSPFRRAPLETREEHLKLLNDYLTLIPYILPPDEFCTPTIWHPDPNGGNIMNGSNFEITGLIDWQHTVIAPYFTQHLAIPTAFKYTEMFLPIPEIGYPSLPDDFEEYDPEFQKFYRSQMQKVTRHRLFEISINKVDPRRAKFYALSHAITSWMFFPLPVLRIWSDGAREIKCDLALTRRYWSEISEEPFPIQMSADDEERWLKEFIQGEVYLENCEQLRRKLEIEGDGLVTVESYENIKKLLADEENTWVDEEKGGPFPFKDGMWSSYLN
ncbi:Mitochondrial inheritance protein 9 [Abortiporus biennis]